MDKTRVVNLRKEPYDIYIGRGSKWGCPFYIPEDGSRTVVIRRYKEYLLNFRPDLIKALPELKGKRLGCFCKPLDCHGDILIELLEGLKNESKSY